MDPQRMLIVRGGTLIDGRGGEPVPNRSIVVEDGRITQVNGPADAPDPDPREARVVDAAGKFIMPGLIDGHVHLSSHQGALPGVRFTSNAEYASLWTARIASRILHAGVTSIAVPGGKWFVDATVRDAVNSGLIEGPRIYCAGRALTPMGGIFDATNPYTMHTADDSVGVLCHSVDDYRREVRRQCKRGVNMIKVADSYWGDTQTVSLDELRAVVDEAHRNRVTVSIHARGSGSTRAAAMAGVDVIYHADLATEKDLDAVVEAGVPIMPVFTQCQIITELSEKEGFTASMRERVKRQLDQNYAAIRMARAKGIQILVGTDSGNAAAFEHGRYHGREAELLVREIGMSPMEAIVASTRDNAKVVGLEGRVGTIESGRLADIIIWNRDPVSDIRVLQQPSLLDTVIKDGRVIDRSRLGFRDLSSEPPRALVTPQG